jgi:hypothetical protein
MSNRLEQYVRDHREEFDGEEPDSKIWDSIRKEIEPPKKKQADVVRLYRARWSVAAAVVLLIAGTIGYYSVRHNNNTGSAVAAGNNGNPKTTPSLIPGKTPAQSSAQSPSDSSRQETTPSLATTSPNDARGADQGNTELDASVNEEMYHYAKLVEIKHKELRTIENDEPMLYKQFSLDVSRLDSAYHNLQGQLPKNPNREQILEAMLQNLQLQMGLLNHQLDIIKQINHSKKTAYEKAYKTT